MLRATLRRLDKTKQPSKIYKYGYQPDPRKFARMEFVRNEELFPRIIRPPSKDIPDTDTFLEKCDIHETVPMSDFKASFKSWEDMMTSRPVENRKTRGMSIKVSRWLAESLDNWRNGRPPEYFDAKDERKYFKQFKDAKQTNRRIPELPEKYRPHQLGEVRALPNYRELNRMPQWAVEEEERLRKAEGKK